MKFALRHIHKTWVLSLSQYPDDGLLVIFMLLILDDHLRMMN